MTIYLDSLILTNIYVNFFILKSVCFITHTFLSFKRIIIGSVIGSLFSIIAILDIRNFFVLILIKFLTTFIIALSVFYKCKLAKLFKYTIMLFFVSFAFFGVASLICKLFKSEIIFINNFTVYFDISGFILMISTVISYILVAYITNILNVKFNKYKSYKINVKIKGREFEFCGICDSANNLFDVFSGKPVIVCNSKDLWGLFFKSDENVSIENILEKGFRFTPFSTISNNGFLPIFKADEICIFSETNEEKLVDAYIGISQNQNREENAIFNPTLLV